MAITTEQLAAYFASFPTGTKVKYNLPHKGDVNFVEEEPAELFIPVTEDGNPVKVSYVVFNPPL